MEVSLRTGYTKSAYVKRKEKIIFLFFFLVFFRDRSQLNSLFLSLYSDRFFTVIARGSRASDSFLHTLHYSISFSSMRLTRQAELGLSVTTVQDQRAEDGLGN